MSQETAKSRILSLMLHAQFAEKMFVANVNIVSISYLNCIQAYIYITENFFCRIELDSDKWHRWQDVEVQADNITMRKQEQETVQK